MFTPRMRHLPLVFAVILIALTPRAAEAQTFTPELTPAAVTVNAGDPAGATFQAAINHDPGFSSSIRVFFGPLPPGLSITPSEQFLNPPYNAITFRVTATAAAAAVNDVMVIYSSSETKTINLRVNVNGGGAPPPGISIAVVPNRIDVAQGQSQSMTVRLSSLNGFQGTVNFTTDHQPSRLAVTPSPFSLTVGPNQTVSQSVTVKAQDGAATGDAGFILYAAAGTLQDSVMVPVTITPGAPPDFTFAVSQPSGALVSGQSTTVTATVTPVNGFSSPVSVAVSSPANAVTANPVTLTGPYSPAPMTLQLNAAGTTSVTFTATSGTLQKTATLSLVVQPAQTPVFDLQVVPSDLAITAGRSGAVTVQVSGSGGFSGVVTVTTPLADPASGISFTPQTFTLAAGESRSVAVGASTARPTTVPLALEFRGVSGALSDSAPLRLTIAPPASGNAPSIQAITPMAYAPMPAQELIVFGRNFAAGATVGIEQPPTGRIEVISTRFISPTQLGATVRVGANTPAGRGYRVTVRNPDGGTTAEEVVLAVAPQGSLGGPAAVTRAAIEYPVRGQVIASGKGSIAAAHLATSGSGTVVGRWRLRRSGDANDPGFVFDQFTATVAGGFLVSTDRPCFDSAGRMKTTAHVCASIPMLHRGAYHVELHVDHPHLATPASVPVTIQTDSATELTIYRPRADAAIDQHDPEFSWTALPGVSHYNVEFVPARAGVQPIVFEAARSTWRPDVRDLGRRGLVAGAYRWRVVAVYPGDLRGQATDWLTISFSDVAFTSAKRVATVASAEVTALDLGQDAGAAEASSLASYTIAPNSTFTGGKDQEARGQFTVSSQGELTGALTSKITADLNYAGSTDPNRLVQDSRNWIVDASTSAERGYGIGAQFGYTTPDFTSGTEYLTSGNAQTGVVGRARSRFGTFSYYQPVSTAIHGVLSGLDEKLEIRSAAFETPEGKPYVLRLIALQVAEPADLDEGVVGSELRTFGLYGKYDLSQALSVVGEVARGRVEAEQSGEGRNGIAARVGLSGSRGTFNYSANVRTIGANFVNPANRGLTPGGVSDRIMVDFNAGKGFGRTMLNFGLRRQDQGRSSDSTMPRADETALNLGLTTTRGRTSVNVMANFTGNRGDGNEETFFPATHRDSGGISTTLSRSFGRLSVAQTLSVQRMTDEINPLTDQTMTTAGLTASGTFLTHLTLNASLNGTRMKGAEGLGTTNSWTASLQPAIAIPVASLSLQPAVSLSRSRNAALATESESEQYNLSLHWSPVWMGNLVAAQLTSSWTGTGAALQHSYLGSVTVRMNKQRGMPWFATAAAQ